MRAFGIQHTSFFVSFVSLATSNLLHVISTNLDSNSLAVKYLPSIDLDSSACFFTAAIDENRNLNTGVEVSRHPEAPPNPWECRNSNRAWAANTYVRQRCTDDGWCAILYGYYFEKDEGGSLDWGHKHDWEHIMVWTLHGAAKWLGWTAHGNYIVNKAENVQWDGDHPKFVVHRHAGTTHVFRRAEPGEQPENPLHQWLRGLPINVQGMDSKVAEDLLRHDWGNAHVDLHEGGFKKAYDSTWNQIKNWNDSRPPRPDPIPPPSVKEQEKEL